jgi:hypothetical protein
MKCVVQRKVETLKSIIGELWVDGQLENLTLEPARLNPVNVGHPCIPAGEYALELTFSPHFAIVTPEVMNVPGRSAIRIHVGNFPKDTLGCTLVGSTKGTDAVYGSKETFEKLMTLLRTTSGPITIEYREADYADQT